MKMIGKCFLQKNELYKEFSNFYLCSFVDDEDNEFHSSEHYFMYRKALTFDPENKEMLDNIKNALTPAKAKELGRKVKNYDDKYWDDVMVDALRLKFGQNGELKKKLLETKNANLYEASPYDSI